MAKPIDTLRDGSLKATIWKRESERGSFYSVNFSRFYRDDEGSYHDADSFSGPELLRLAHLAAKAYDRTSQLRQEDSADAEKAGAA